MFLLVAGTKEIKSKKDGRLYYLVDGVLVDEDGIYPIPFNQNFIEKVDFDSISENGNGLYSCKYFRNLSNLVFAGRIESTDLIALADNT